MKYIDADQIRAEIERRYAEYRAKMKTDDFTYYEGMADALDLFEQYIDSLPEQPVEIKIENPNIEKADPNVKVETRTDGTGDMDGKAMLYVAEKSYKIGFRDGKASKEQPASDGLEKAAGEYAVDNAQYYYEDDDNAICSTADILKPAFIAGAEWGMNQCPLPEDTTTFNKGVEEGKRLMMDEAVDGYVNYYEDSGGILMAEAQVGCPYHNGDKVKIIVIKED